MFYLRSGCCRELAGPARTSYVTPSLKPSPRGEGLATNLYFAFLPLKGLNHVSVLRLVLARPARNSYVTPSLNPSPRGEGLTIALQAPRR